MKAEEIQRILAQHDAYWDDQRAELRELKSFYMTRYWKERQSIPYGDMSQVLRTELPKAFAVVESYLGSLYAKNPAVICGPDIRGRGNPQVSEATANRYLLTAREQIEDATRLALCFPCAFLKLAPVANVDPLKRVSTAAVPPWEVILDARPAAGNHSDMWGMCTSCHWMRQLCAITSAGTDLLHVSTHRGSTRPARRSVPCSPTMGRPSQMMGGGCAWLSFMICRLMSSWCGHLTTKMATDSFSLV